VDDKLIEIKNKYLSELAEVEVLASDLLSKKLPVNVFKLEDYLFEIYGDKIYTKKQAKSVENKQKSIKKISKNDMEISKILKEFNEEISNTEFDRMLESILR